MAIVNAAQDSFAGLVAGEFSIVDYWSTTCGPCRVFARILEDLDAEIPFLNIVKVNIADCPELAREHRISAVPTVQVYKNGELIMTHVGLMQADAVKAVLAEHYY